MHALGQVAHFDLGRAWPVDTVRAAVNFHLKPDPIAVLDCAIVADDFDARFSATARHYRYRILARPAPPVLDRDRVWWVPQPMHVERDAGGARRRWSAGTTSRPSAPPAARPNRRSRRSTGWRSRRSGEEIRIAASARSFLHNQVRSMVGSLKLVGEGKWRAADLEAALEARDRAACGPVAPARGLYLVRVDYAPSGPARDAGGGYETGGEADVFSSTPSTRPSSWPRLRIRPVAAMTL